MVPRSDPVSAYLLRPIRTLRQSCVDSAHRRGRERPDCEDCNLEAVCKAQEPRPAAAP